MVAVKLLSVSSVTASEKESITVPGAGGCQLLPVLPPVELQAAKRQDIDSSDNKVVIFIGYKNMVL